MQAVLLYSSGEVIFDFSAVNEADSSAIAVMLGWLRAADAAQCPCQICPYSGRCAFAG